MTSVSEKPSVFVADTPMDRRHHTRACTACWRLTAAFACGVLVFAWSESAQATCGDWLADHGIADSGISEMRDGSSRTAIHDTLPEADAQQTKGRRPCNGPACSRLPDLPLSPSGPAEPITPTSRLHAVVAHGSVLPAPGASWLAIEGPLLFADVPASRIERPPMRG